MQLSGRREAKERGRMEREKAGGGTKINTSFVYVTYFPSSLAHTIVILETPPFVAP